MRPIGAWAMGIYADHKGRKAGLTLSVTLVCWSLLIASPRLTPKSSVSPAILLIARLIQVHRWRIWFKCDHSETPTSAAVSG